MRSFQPNCTSPTSIPSFVSAANVRGTLDILWPCMTILLLCTWSIQHLNVPPQFRSKSFWKWMRYQTYLFWRKSRWMIITMIAPEILFGFAIDDLGSSRYNAKEIKRFVEEDEIDWSLSHSYFANMGGFVIDFPQTLTATGPEIEHSSQVNAEPTALQREETNSNTPTQNERPNPIKPKPSKPDPTVLMKLREIEKRTGSNLKDFCNRNTNNRGFLGDSTWTCMGKNKELAKAALEPTIWDTEFCSVNNYHDNLKALQGNIWVLDANQLLYARHCRIITRLPVITKEELDDKNKGNSIIKFLALLQISWLVLQLVVRRVQDLAVSQLEIGTLAFAASSFIIYCIFWKKPQDSRCPVHLTAARFPTLEEMITLAGKGPAVYIKRASWCIPSNSVHYAGTELMYNVGFALGFGLGSIIFGGMHLLAWNFQFPHPMEQLFWRISTVLAVAIPCVSFLVTLGVVMLFDRAHFLWIISMLVLIPACVLARLFMMVEIFRTLYYLPPSAYRSTWSANVPHFG